MCLDNLCFSSMVIHHNVLIYISFYTLKPPHCDKFYSFFGSLKEPLYCPLQKSLLWTSPWGRLAQNALMAAWKVLQGALGQSHLMAYLCCEPSTKCAVPRVWAVAFPGDTGAGWARRSFGVAKNFLGNFSVLVISQSGMGGKRCHQELLPSSLGTIKGEKPADAPLNPLVFLSQSSVQGQPKWSCAGGATWVEHLLHPSTPSTVLRLLWSAPAHVLARKGWEINKSYWAPRNHRTVPYFHSSSAQENININTCQKCCCRFELLMTSLEAWALFAGNLKIIFSILNHRKKYM